jgi:hypothetical protein
MATTNGIDMTGMTPEMRDMLAQVERDYVGWDPDIQPQIVGTLADYKDDCDCGGYGSHYLLFIDAPNGDGIGVHCFGTTLRNQIEPKIKSHRLDIGDLIAIAYLGTKDSQVKGHNAMSMYRVVIRHKGPAALFSPNGEQLR